MNSEARRLVALLAHGSPDPRSSAAARELAVQVGGLLPEARVEAAFLDHDEPTLAQLVESVAPTDVRVVPLFLNDAFHARVDVPAAVDAAREHCPIITVTASLADRQAVFDWMDSRLPAGAPVVMATAGTRNADAQQQLCDQAQRWSEQRGTEVVVAYATMAQPTIDEALTQLGPSAAVATYVLFPGSIADRIAAHAGPGHPVTPPLCEAPTLPAVVASLS